MRGNLGNLMKQAQKMQDDLKRAQEEIARLEVEGSAGGGAVKVTMNGKHEVSRVAIDPAAMDDRETLEDLVTAAVNDAARKIDAASSARMGSVAGGLAGLGLPGGFKLPF
jgi:hypothetical protein